MSEAFGVQLEQCLRQLHLPTFRSNFSAYAALAASEGWPYDRYLLELCELEAELGYGMPVGGRLVGMPSFGIGASGHGRDYRLGYGLTVAQDGAMHFELGIDANRRESPSQGTAEHGVLGRLTARW